MKPLKKAFNCIIFKVKTKIIEGELINMLIMTVYEVSHVLIINARNTLNIFWYYVSAYNIF